MKPVVLCILDGVGINENTRGNAVKNAKKPFLDSLWERYPHSYLEASGVHVGLPKGQMGNSEVGHMNIGAGRIVYQPLELINREIDNGNFFQNKNILMVIHNTKQRKSKLHIMGLISDGGVHSCMKHLMSVIDMCVQNNIEQLYFHLFLDGRDTLDHSAYQYVEMLEEKIKETGIGKIVTMSGRYYAMDRDNNWDRVQLAYNAIVYGEGEKFKTPKEMIEFNYKNNRTDEFMLPAVLNEGKVEDGDGIIVFNYRPDRLRELFSSLTNPAFDKMNIKKLKDIELVTMMPVSEEVVCKNAYQHQSLKNTLGCYVSEKGFKQLRIAETEKYAHVTYFFDGGYDFELPQEKRILIKSPSVATYDLKPTMSAEEITTTLIQELDHHYDLVILNYANGDMVGHTGNYEAAKIAVEFLDTCVEKIYHKIMEKDGTLIITADHGNCEEMLDDEGHILTSHTTNKVPFLITDEQYSLRDGKLCDIAPTILQLMNLEKPEEMTGSSLIQT